MNSIEEMSIVGLGQRLFKHFELPYLPIECPTNDRLHLAANLAAKKGEKPQFPILAYSLANIGPSETGANPTAWQHAAMQTQKRQDTIGSMQVIPVTLQFGVTYLDNDRVRLLRFMAKWMQARASGALNFRLRVDSIPVDIQAKPEDSLAAPQKDIMTESINQYELSGTISMNTWISGEFADCIKQITRIKEMTTSMAAPPIMPADVPTASATPEQALAREESIANFGEDVNRNLIFSVKTTMPGG